MTIYRERAIAECVIKKGWVYSLLTKYQSQESKLASIQSVTALAKEWCVDDAQLPVEIEEGKKVL